MPIPLRDLPQRNMFIDEFRGEVVGVRCGDALVFGTPVYHECGRPPGYYLEFGDGVAKKSVGPLKGGDMLEYVNSKRV